MDRRELLGLFGAGAAGLVAMGGTAGTARAADHEHSEHTMKMGECALICNEAAHHCLTMLRQGMGDKEHHAKAHELTMDCQAFCVLAATLSARHSPLAAYAHEACADACRDCAAECEKSKDKHEVMTECARICRECEKGCRELAKNASKSG